MMILNKNSKTNKEIQSNWRKNHHEVSKTRNRSYNREYRERLKNTLTEEEKDRLRKAKNDRQRRFRKTFRSKQNLGTRLGR